MNKYHLLFLSFLLFLLVACSHAQTASDVLPFRDGDVQAVEIYAQRPAPEGFSSHDWYYTELTEPAAMDALLSLLRGMQSLGRFDGGHGVSGGDGYAFIFHLADGQLYTAGLSQDYRNHADEETAVFQCDLLRVQVEYVSGDFCATLDELAGNWASVSDSDDIVCPYYGYTLPGDPPLVVDPYSQGGEAAPRPDSTDEVLAFDDKDVVGLTIYDCLLDDLQPNFHMEVTDPEITAEILAHLRAARIWEYGEAGPRSGARFFAFHLADGRLYTVGYAEFGSIRLTEMVSSLSTEDVGLIITYDPELHELLDSLDYERIPSHLLHGIDAPPLGYSTPGED